MTDLGRLFAVLAVWRAPAERVAWVLLILGAAALLWTGWSGAWSWLVVSIGLLLAGGLVAVALDRFEERHR